MISSFSVVSSSRLSAQKATPLKSVVFTAQAFGLIASSAMRTIGIDIGTAARPLITATVTRLVPMNRPIRKRSPAG